jgi:hypothetical protein
MALASFPGHSAIRNPHSAFTPGPLDLILAPYFSFQLSTFYFRLVEALSGFAAFVAIRCWMLDVGCSMFRCEVSIRCLAPLKYA